MAHNETPRQPSYYQEIIMFMAKFSGEYQFGEYDGVWIAMDCSDGLQVITKEAPTVYDAVEAAMEWQKEKEKREEEAKLLRDSKPNCSITWTP